MATIPKYIPLHLRQYDDMDASGREALDMMARNAAENVAVRNSSHSPEYQLLMAKHLEDEAMARIAKREKAKGVQRQEPAPQHHHTDYDEPRSGLGLPVRPPNSLFPRRNGE